MAKLIYSAITSLDGYVEDEDGNFDWAAPDEEVHSFVNDLERPVGTYLYGRRMYETILYRPPGLSRLRQPVIPQVCLLRSEHIRSPARTLDAQCHAMCARTLTIVPPGSSTKKRRTPHGSSVLPTGCGRTDPAFSPSAARATSVHRERIPIRRRVSVVCDGVDVSTQALSRVSFVEERRGQRRRSARGSLNRWRVSERIRSFPVPTWLSHWTSTLHWASPRPTSNRGRTPMRLSRPRTSRFTLRASRGSSRKPRCPARS